MGVRLDGRLNDLEFQSGTDGFVISVRPTPYRQLGKKGIRYSQVGTKCACDGQYHSREADAVMVEGRGVFRIGSILSGLSDLWIQEPDG